MGDFVSTSMGRLGFSLPRAFLITDVYNKRDIVLWQSSAYVVLRDGVTGITPGDDGVTYALFAGRGEPGASNAVWHAGTAVSGTGTGIVASVPGSKTGDMYINQDTGDVYIAIDADTWDFVRNVTGQKGADGQGVPIGGTMGQMLSKASAADFDTRWKALLAADIGTATADTSVQEALDTIPTASAPLSLAGGGLGASHANAAEARTTLGLKSGALRETQQGVFALTMLPGETASAVMDFPIPFLSTPRMAVALNNSSPYNKSVGVAAITATSATFYLYYSGTAVGATASIQWIAIC